MRIECEDTGEIVYGYSEYLKSNHWFLKKQEVALAFANEPRCKLCKKEGRLSVHHKTYKRIGRECVGDLIYLCQPCHTALHGIMKRLQESGCLEINNQYTDEYSAMKKTKRLAVKDVLKKEQDKNNKAKYVLRKSTIGSS